MSAQHWIATSVTNETIAERYRRIGGFTHGFDYLRIALAAAIVVQHSVVSSYGGAAAGELWNSWVRMFLAPLLPMFFALSGFLVAGSLKKNPLALSFLSLRALRLLPALAVEILLSALLLGPLLTEYSLSEYFRDSAFLRYFANIVGWIHMELPGVYLDLPYPHVVNLSLWTIPYELECYIALILLYLLGILRNRTLLLIIIGIGIVAGTTAALSDFDSYWASNRPLPRSLVVAFLAGVAMNAYSERLYLSGRLALFSLAATILFTLDYRTIYLAVIPAAYLCIYLGMMHPPKRGILFTGDYSYGLYLFAFPIQQAYTLLFPALRHWYLNAAFTLLFGLLFAALSWWLIEKPALSHRARVLRTAERLQEAALRALMPRRTQSIEPSRG